MSHLSSSIAIGASFTGLSMAAEEHWHTEPFKLAMIASIEAALGKPLPPAWGDLVANYGFPGGHLSDQAVRDFLYNGPLADASRDLSLAPTSMVNPCMFYGNGQWCMTFLIELRLRGEPWDLSDAVQRFDPDTRLPAAVRTALRNLRFCLSIGWHHDIGSSHQPAV